LIRTQRGRNDGLLIGYSLRRNGCLIKSGLSFRIYARRWRSWHRLLCLHCLDRGIVGVQPDVHPRCRVRLRDVDVLRNIRLRRSILYLILLHCSLCLWVYRLVDADMSGLHGRGHT
jgi:hypothetical protein